MERKVVLNLGYFVIKSLMKVVSSLKSLKKRDLIWLNKLIKRKGKLYVINKNPRMKSRQ